MSRITLTTDIKKCLTALPESPGVYQMICADTTLYVGKARNLKKRVSSYFNKQLISTKIQSLVSQIQAIEIHVTQTETEALLLESNLIKSLRPKYNVLMRDDKSYPYLFINTHHSFPRLELYRGKKKPKQGLSFGPYPSVAAVKETLHLMQKVFLIRNCRDGYFAHRSRPCLQYQIKRCTAPCVGYISQTEYQQAVSEAIMFLQGKSQLIIERLLVEMNDAVAQLHFEQAALKRDKIKSLRMIQERQSISYTHGEADVIAFEARQDFACVQCISIRDGQVVASQRFFPVLPKTWLSDVYDIKHASWAQQVLEAFITHHYGQMPDTIPDLLIIDKRIHNAAALQTLLTSLRGRKCRVQTCVQGAKKRWVEFAQNNLQLAIKEYYAKEEKLTEQYQALAKLLHITAPIKRMECFDISHTQGHLTVASCVVFDQKGPNKSLYRQFNITGITPGDDYAAMNQALTRRYQRLLAEDNLPDLLIIDGGKGQISAAMQVLTHLNIIDLPVLGIAKGPQRKAGLERLIYQGQEFALAADSAVLHLLQHIRDEAHRFAITRHRQKRQKAATQSSLEDIEGVGAVRRRALLQRFGGIKALAQAPLEEIMKVRGIHQELAARIYQYFR
ncbi:MAG: excinuclease ABC subunit C [Legionellaceae bacterium]|nr:excinuclease ABC subunit C [Legionellaceae bacterium]